MSQITIESLTRIGGREWTAGDKRRVYFNDLASLFGLKVERYKTGNISSASLNGQQISNSRAGELCVALKKFWWDAVDGKFYGLYGRHRDYSTDEMHGRLVEAVKARLAA